MLRLGRLTCAVALLAVGALPAAAQTSALISQPTAARYGLERAWFTQAAVDRSSSKLANLSLNGDLLMSQTSRNVVQGIDAATGYVRWTVKVGDKSPAIAAPAASAAGVGVLTDSSVLLLDRENGRVIWEQKLDSSPMTGLAMNDTWMFVPIRDGRCMAFNLADPKKDPWFFRAAGMIYQPPTITRAFVTWVNNHGVLYASEQGARKLQFEFEAQGSVATPLAYWPPNVYMVDSNYNLFAVSAEKNSHFGRQAWRYPLGGPVRLAPVALEDAVFVVREDYGMLCINSSLVFAAAKDKPAGKEPAAEEPAAEEPAAEEPAAEEAAAEEGAEAAPARPAIVLPSTRPGTLRWTAPGITQFVAASPTHIFAADRLGRLVALNIKTGAVLTRMNAEFANIKLVNTQDDRIYFGSSAGLIQSLHELGLPQPVVHQWPVDEVKKPAAIQAIGAEPAADGEEPAPEAN